MREDTRDKISALNSRFNQLSEGYSVASYDQLEKLHRSVERVLSEINDALIMAGSVEPSSVQADSRQQIADAVSLLKQARDQARGAMRVLMPDMEYHGFFDTTV